MVLITVRLLLSVCLLGAMWGCSTAPSVPAIPESRSIEGVDYGSKAAVIQSLDARKIDAIEGIWVWSDNQYEVVIIKNTTNIETAYEYVGVILRAEESNWKPGKIKLLLNSTSVESVFTGVYFMGDETRRNTNFILEGNLIKTFLPIAPSETLLLRNYPKTAKTSKSRTPIETHGASQGTGFFVSSTGYILTNHHVIANAKTISVRLPDGRKTTASVVRSSPSTDLALIKSDLSSDQFLSVSSTAGLGIGESVYTIGYPSVDLLGPSAKLTDGVVSSMAGLKDDNVLIQVTVPVQPGNSGGPIVLKKSGTVIGILTSTAAVESFYAHTGSLPQNINWAVKADYALPLMGGLIPEVAHANKSREASEVAKAIVIIEIEK
jgi:S1-C subfamily serine protease